MYAQIKQGIKETHEPNCHVHVFILETKILLTVGV